MAKGKGLGVTRRNLPKSGKVATNPIGHIAAKAGR